MKSCLNTSLFDWATSLSSLQGTSSSMMPQLALQQCTIETEETTSLAATSKA